MSAVLRAGKVPVLASAPRNDAPRDADEVWDALLNLRCEYLPGHEDDVVLGFCLRAVGPATANSPPESERSAARERDGGTVWGRYA